MLKEKVQGHCFTNFFVPNYPEKYSAYVYHLKDKRIQQGAEIKWFVFN